MWAKLEHSMLKRISTQQPWGATNPVLPILVVAAGTPIKAFAPTTYYRGWHIGYWISAIHVCVLKTSHRFITPQPPTERLIDLTCGRN